LPTLFQVKSYLSYWLDAVDDHSLHSPFLYDFYNTILHPSGDDKKFEIIEELRKQLLADHRIIDLQDLGAGSVTRQGSSRKIADIARTSLSQTRFSELYARIIQKFQHKNILETGTSLGINTLYLAASPGVTVTTFEGAPAIANIARDTVTLSEASNITIIEGNLNTTLQPFLQKSPRIDFAFLDANHRYDATLKYFSWLLPRIHERSTVILDDIHLSPEMECAWNEIKNHKLVYTSIDLYRCGLLFFDPSLNKQHVVLQY